MCGKGKGIYCDPENIEDSVNTNILLPVLLDPQSQEFKGYLIIGIKKHWLYLILCNENVTYLKTYNADFIIWP